MRILSIGIAALFAVCAMTVSADVRWIEADYDFGLMKEIAGPKTGSARFVNIGPGEVSVIEAKPTCGCTSTAIPEDPVAVGDTATVSFTYDPTGRPGRFEKSIRVLFSDGRRHRIGIRGNVLGTPESLEIFYPVEVGPVRLDNSAAMGGRIMRGKQPSVFVNVYNQRPDTVRIRLASPDKALALKAKSSKIGPGDIMTIGFYFDTWSWKMPGQVKIPVTLTAIDTDGSETEYTIPYCAEVVAPPEDQKKGKK